jgi:hypothetical protein
MEADGTSLPFTEGAVMAALARFALLVGVAIVLPAGHAGDKAREEQKQIEREAIANWYGQGDVIVATVVKESAHAGTISNPPRPILRVDEVWRGDKGLDRSNVLWGPLFAPRCGNDPGLNKWLATPFAGPKVGEKWILFGRLGDGDEKKLFLTWGQSRFPYTPENEKKYRALMKEADEIIRQRNAEREAKEKAHREALAKWREASTEKRLKQYVAEADFIGIGRRVSGTPLYEIDIILKGERKHEYLNNAYFVQVVFPENIERFIEYQKTPYLLFLTEKGLKPNPSGPLYQPIAGGDGIVIADAESIRAVGAAVKAPRPK